MAKKTISKRKVVAKSTSTEKKLKTDLKMPFMVWLLSALAAPVLILLVPSYFGEVNFVSTDVDEISAWGQIWGMVILTLPTLIMSFVISLAINKEYFGSNHSLAGIVRMSLVIAAVINVFVFVIVNLFSELFPGVF